MPISGNSPQPVQKNYTTALVLVTSLFFLWGFAYGLLDVLNKHFQETLHVTKTRSALLQAAYFGAYFLIALPAGLFMNRYGYKKGIIMGLLLYAIGAFLFYPAAQTANFDFFLLALFILASGLACLETAANPYVTVLGKPETSETRLNLSQCFNGVGSTVGPILAARFFFGGTTAGEGKLESVKIIYLVIGVVVLLIAGFFMRTPLPEIKDSETVSTPDANRKPLLKHSNFTAGVVAQFFYVAAQVGVGAFFLNYCTETSTHITTATASGLVSVGLGVFTVGRFIGTALMRVIAPNKLLGIYSIINILLCGLVIAHTGWLSIYSLIGIFFFESIMFPTIFALAVKDVGTHTKRASSFIIMSIVGGAIMPYVMGLLSDKYSTATAYAVPLACFIIVAWYGFKGSKVEGSTTAVKVEFKH